METLKELIIKESEWLRGETHDPSFLLRSSDKKKCCQGFLGKACGYTDGEIEDKKTPADVTVSHGFVGKWPKLLMDDRRLFIDILDINDSDEISDDERKASLIPLFERLGYKLVFVP